MTLITKQPVWLAIMTQHYFYRAASKLKLKILLQLESSMKRRSSVCWHFMAWIFSDCFLRFHWVQYRFINWFRSWTKTPYIKTKEERKTHTTFWKSITKVTPFSNEGPILHRDSISFHLSHQPPLKVTCHFLCTKSDTFTT